MAANIAVIGVYPPGVDAEGGAADLIVAGFPSADISVLLPDPRSKRERASADPAGNCSARVGGLLSGALGILTGGSIRVIPGMGPIIAAGPLAARVEHLVSGGAEGLAAALLEWGVPADEAKAYEGRIQDGGTLLAVRCESPARAKRASQVLNSSGADHVAALQVKQSPPLQPPASKSAWALI